MLGLIKNICFNVLSTLYQSFGFAVIVAILFMFAWLQNSTVKEAVKKWTSAFKNSRSFRKMFFLVLYSSLIIFRTLLNRNMWLNPLSNIVGTWGLYKLDTSTQQMVLTTEVPENLALFIPFTILLLWIYRDKILNNGKKDNSGISLPNVLWQSTKIVFLFSFTIEFLQLFLRLGTWQLSDLFFNTLGGFIGGLVYWIGYKVKHRGSGV